MADTPGAGRRTWFARLRLGCARLALAGCALSGWVVCGGALCGALSGCASGPGGGSAARGILYYDPALQDYRVVAIVTPDAVWVRRSERLIGTFSFSPDGRWLLYSARLPGAARRDIFIARADGSAEQNLTRQAGSSWSATWSPDGQFIYFTSNREGPRHVYRMRPDGAEVQNISGKDESEGYDLSPDGTRIVFSAALAGAGQRSLIVAAADGSSPRTLVQNGAEGLWSPDGQWILHKHPGDPGLYLIHPDGSGARKIGGNGRALSWTPDSAAILYSDVSSIRLARIDGSADKMVVPNVEAGMAPLPRCAWGGAGPGAPGPDAQKPDTPKAEAPGAGALVALDATPGADARALLVLNGAGAPLAASRRAGPQRYANACWGSDGKTTWFLKLPTAPAMNAEGICILTDHGTRETEIVPDHGTWQKLPPGAEAEQAIASARKALRE